MNYSDFNYHIRTLNILILHTIFFILPLAVYAEDVHNTTQPTRSRPAIVVKEEISKAKQLQSEGKDEEALKALDRALSERVANSDALYLKALSLRKLGRYDEARQNLEEALWFSKSKDITIKQIKLELANCYIALDMKAKAMEILQGAVAQDPNSPELLLEIGKLQITNGEKALALTNLRNASQQSPDNIDIKLALAEALLHGVKRGGEQSNVNEARDISKKLMESQRKGDLTWRSSVKLYTRSLIELGELEEADKTIKKALKAIPQDSDLQRLNTQIMTEKRAMENIPVG